MFAAGVDWTTPRGYERTFEDFDRVIGLRHLEAFHLNDSKKPLGSRVDRHAIIGDGLIGLEPFKRLVRDQRFAQLPGYLETPAAPGRRGELRARPFSTTLAARRRPQRELTDHGLMRTVV